MRDRHQSILWLLLLAVVVAGFFHECVFRGFSLVPADLLHQLILPYSADVERVRVQNHYAFDALTADYGWGVFWQQSVRAGEMPLWNPYIFGGHPHLAANMEAALSPYRALYLFLSAERAFTLGIILQFLLSAVFMFAFLRELGRSQCASFVGACAFALNSAFLMWYWRVPGPLSWVPLVLLLFERSMRKESWGYAVGGGVVLGLSILSGSMQAAVHVGFLCAVYFAVAVFRREPSQRARTVACVAAMFAVAALVAAAQLVPTAELLRAEGGGEQLGPIREHARPSLRHTALGLPFLVTLVFPGLAGSPESYDLLKAVGASMADFTGYIGLVPFVLFVVGVFGAREWRVRGLLLLIVAVLAVVFFTPLLKYVYHRVFIVMVFAASVIAAYGADVLLDASAQQAKVVRRVFAVMLGICLLLALGLVAAQVVIHLKWDEWLRAGQQYVLRNAHRTAFATKQEWLAERVGVFLGHYRISNVVFWLPVVSVSVLALVWRAYTKGIVGRPALCGALVVLTVCDLSVMGRQWVPQVDLEKNPLFPATEVLAPAQADPELFRVRQFAPGNWLVLPNSLLMHYGLASWRGNESLWPVSIDALPAYRDGEFNSLLDLQNVRYLLTETGTSLPAGRFELLAESGGIRLYRNNHCLPRLQFVPRWQVVSDRKQMLDLLTAKSFDPCAIVLLEQEPPIEPFPAAADATPHVELKWYRPRSVAAHVRTAQPGILLLADTFYPGWQARVDGQPAPVLRADYVLKAVALPPGEHEVEFYYAPRSFRIGATISLMTLGALLVFGVWRGARDWNWPRRRNLR